MLKLGDKVVVINTKDTDENIVGNEGIISAINKELTTEYLVDFGKGFNGHYGTNMECKTATAWYMMGKSLKKVK